MSQDISLKQFGVTIEIQIDGRYCYINPFEKGEDRRPENGELIFSFIRAGVSELHMKSDLASHLSGLARYGFDRSRFLVCPKLQAHIRATSEAGDSEFTYRSGIRPLDSNVLELDQHLIGTDVLSQGNDLYGIGLTIDDFDFHYFYIDDKYVEDFLERSSNCAMLITENWSKAKDSIRKIVLADKSQYYYIACDDLRKNDLTEFQSMLLPKSAEKIICKKSKWKYPD